MPAIKPLLISSAERQWREPIAPNGGVDKKVLANMARSLGKFAAHGGTVVEFTGPTQEPFNLVFDCHNQSRYRLVKGALQDATFGHKLVALDQHNQVVGAINFWFHGRSIGIGNLASLYSGQGIGTALEVAIASLAARRGFSIRSSYAPRAKTFHKKIGRWVGICQLSLWTPADTQRIARYLPRRGVIYLHRLNPAS
jgi:hypothetical protein